jgi:hypothetical protein
MKLRRSSVEPPTGSMNWPASFSLTSGSSSAALISLFRRSTISVGVDAGAITAIQAMFSISGSPASFIVGISGVSALRLAVETASGRSLPALTCGITATAGTQRTARRPAAAP